MKRSTHAPDLPTVRGARLAGAALRVIDRMSPRAAAAIAQKLFTTPRRYGPPPREVTLLRLAEAADVPTPAGRIATWRWGPSEGAPTVMLVHGWEGRGAQLGAFVEPLRAAGMSVVAFDGPSHGASDGRSVDFMHFVQALLAVAGRAGPLHGAVSHSFGAIATSAALAWGLRVGRGVYLAPGVSPLGATRRMGRMLGVPDRLIERMRANLTRQVGLRWEELEPDVLLPGLGHVPLRVLYSEDDVEVPRAAVDQLIRHWPGAELRLFDGLGHRGILWAPAAVDAAVEFLTRP